MSEASSEMRSTPSPWMGWTLAVLAAPLLYLLVIPPLYFMTVEDLSTPPALWIKCVKPYQWMADNTPLEGVLERYVEYWRDALRP